MRVCAILFCLTVAGCVQGPQYRLPQNERAPHYRLPSCDTIAIPGTPCRSTAVSTSVCERRFGKICKQ